MYSKIAIDFHVLLFLVFEYYKLILSNLLFSAKFVFA